MIYNKKLLVTHCGICLILLFPGLFNSGHEAHAETGKAQYYAADRAYKKLRHDVAKQKYRNNWLKCIQKYHAVYEKAPHGSWAAAGLYMTAKLYQELYRHSYAQRDRQQSVAIHQKIIQEFPQSRYRIKSENALKKLGVEPMAIQPEPALPSSTAKETEDTPKPVLASLKPQDSKPKRDSDASAVTETPTIDKRVATAQDQHDPSQADKNDTMSLATVTNLRYWSNPNYTRVVIDLDQQCLYAHRMLKKDPSIHKPQRLYIDLNRSRLRESFQRTIPINDNLLKNARAGQFSPQIVRVVIDIKSFKTYKIFSLTNPFRIVIDVWGNNTPDRQLVRSSTPKQTAGNNPVKALPNSKLTTSAIAKQLSLGVKKIVIDPGHGGKDYGAPGYYKGVHEKFIVLKIAQKLARMIERELKCEVVLTRTDDRFLTLEERTALANTQNADLFISIHTNASRDKRAYGTETYFLNLATDNDAILVAARENATSTRNISDLQTILNDLMQNAKINESSRLAANVENDIIQSLKHTYSRIKNKGVKQAPFYVLLGAQMPAILVETGFISNARECRRLNQSKYQDRLCRAITQGIKKYIFETNPTAFMEYQPNGAKKDS